MVRFFRKRYGQVENLKNQIKKVGDVGVLKRDGRYIFYLATKNLHNKKPSLRNIFLTLRNLRKLIIDLKIKKIALPRICAGKDETSWGVVQNFLIFLFRSIIDLKIIICYLK